MNAPPARRSGHPRTAGSVQVAATVSVFAPWS